MERLALDRWSSPWLRHQHLARYRWAASFTRGRRVLDAACGTGYGARMLLDGSADSVDGVDRSPRAIAEAKSAATPHLRFFVGDVEGLPLPGGTYDVYVCFETLEHVRDEGSLLSEARRVLKRGGVFICSTPNRSVISPGRRLADRPANPYHVREYALQELETLLEAFFGSVELYGQTAFPSGYVRRLNQVGELSPGLALRIHQLRKMAGLPWESIDRHRPLRFPLNGEPEALIAVCPT